MFSEAFEMQGDSLKRPPRGYPDDHRFIDDLKRKDFIALKPLTKKQVTSKDFAEVLATGCRDAKPYVRYLCRALDVPF